MCLVFTVLVPQGSWYVLAITIRKENSICSSPSFPRSSWVFLLLKFLVKASMKSQNRVAQVCQLFFCTTWKYFSSTILSSLSFSNTYSLKKPNPSAFGTVSATRFTASLKTATYNELILQLEKGCVILKETDMAGKERSELCTESTGILPTYLCLDFTELL